MKPLYNDNIKGISFKASNKKWRAYINDQYIGTFNKKVEAIYARLIMEEIFKNVISKLDVKAFTFNRDNETISIELSISTNENMIIKTNILYPNNIKKFTVGVI